MEGALDATNSVSNCKEPVSSSGGSSGRGVHYLKLVSLAPGPLAQRSNNAFFANLSHRNLDLWASCGGDEILLKVDNLRLCLAESARGHIRLGFPSRRKPLALLYIL